MKIFIINLFIFLNGLNWSAWAWKEASQCTSTGLLNSNENQINHNGNVNANILDLNCGSDLIYIASSHYGHKTDELYLRKKELLLKTSANETQYHDCSYQSNDCIVKVDYIANECNGLSSCQISLDAQYLHSCKSYSDYLFIIYDCIEAKSTVNICDDSLSAEFRLNYNDYINGPKPTFYLQSPNYPNEYANNLDCSCSIRANGGSSTQIELLEFDLESSSSSSSSSESNANTNANPNNSSSTCLKDFLSINNQTKLCGTQTQFSSLLIRNKISSENDLINVRLLSDDALTRRGFWLKLRLHKDEERSSRCPQNYILIDNKCIKLVLNQQLTWYEANAYCNSLEGHQLVSMDNFEFEKKLNKILYKNSNDEAESDLDDSNLKFWIGLKHLNQTNWFDSNNMVLEIGPSEKNWWPWLIVDSKTYSHGSCAAKKKNFLFLSDCYKRMPFACQLKTADSRSYLIESERHRDDDRVQIKCGRRVSEFFTTTTTRMSISTRSTTVDSHIDIDIDSRNKMALLISTSTKQPFKSDILTLDSKETFGDNSQLLKSKSNLISPVSTGSDSTLIIGLICSITILIAAINTIVVVVICRKRNLSLKYFQSDYGSSSNGSNDTKSSSASSSSTSSIKRHSQKTNQILSNMMETSSTSSSSSFEENNHNVASNTGFNLIATSSATPAAASSTLTFGRLGLLNNNSTNAFMFDRRSLFLNSNELTLHNQNISKTLLVNNHNNHNNNNNNNNNNFHLRNKQQANLIYKPNQANLDPLSHIYETISLSSSTNNLNANNNNNNTSRSRYNISNLISSNGSNLNPYIEIEDYLNPNNLVQIQPANRFNLVHNNDATNGFYSQQNQHSYNLINPDSTNIRYLTTNQRSNSHQTQPPLQQSNQTGIIFNNRIEAVV